MIYLASFAVSAVLAHFAAKQKNKPLFYLLSFFSVAVVILVAGLRDFSIGIDTISYFEKKLYWDGAIKSATFRDYILFYIDSGYGEPLFAALVGIVSQFTGDYSVFLTLVHAVIIICVYVGAMRLKEWVNPAIVLLIFYFFFFNHSLNGIRQYMAMALIFAFFADLLQKKYLKFFIAVLVALTIHTISIVALGFIALHLIMYHPKMPFTLRQREIGISALLGLAILGFKPLVYIAVKLGILNKRYFYIFQSNVEPAIIIALIVVMGLAAVFYFRKDITARCEHSEFFIMCSVCYLLLLMLTFFVALTKRIAIVFGMADMVTLALIQSSQTEKRKKILVTVGILGVAFVYWFYVYIFRNASHTFPYNFFFLTEV